MFTSFQKPATFTNKTYHKKKKIKKDKFIIISAAPLPLS